MIPSFECDFNFDDASVRLKSIAASLVEEVIPAGQNLKIPADTGLPSEKSYGDGEVFVVREGGLRLLEGDRVILTFEEGEAVLVPPLPLRLMAPDFAVAADIITKSQIAEADPPSFTALARFFAEMWVAITARVIRKTEDVLPSTRLYHEGAVIIEQGAVARDVYTLVEGEADVFVDGVCVGEVRTNDFFGVLAAVMDGRRTASVVARTQCLVLAVPMDHFQELIQARPALVEKLVIELGRTITDLNSKLVDITKRESGQKWK